MIRFKRCYYEPIQTNATNRHAQTNVKELSKFCVLSWQLNSLFLFWNVC